MLKVKTKLFMVRVLDYSDDSKYWDSNLEPTEETIDEWPHETFEESAQDVIAEIQTCTQYEPPTQEELDELEPGQVITKVHHQDHGEGDWGGHSEGYLVKRIR